MNSAAALSLLIKAETVVQRQLEATTARLGRWLATYKPDAEQYLLHAVSWLQAMQQFGRECLIGSRSRAAAELVHVPSWTTSSLTRVHYGTFPDGIETVR